MKKLISLLAVLILLAAVFTGCAKTEVSETTTNTNTNGEAVSAEEDITIQVFHYMVQETKQAALLDVEAAYQAIHPNVQFENIVYNQGTDYFPQLNTALASGDQPEIIQGNPGRNPELVEEGFAMDLTDNEVINSLGLSAGDIGDASIGDTVYAFPIDFKTWGAFYNVTYFEENGLSVPTTHTEMLALCQQIADLGMDPWIHALGDGVYGDIEVRNTYWPRAVEAGDLDIHDKLMSGEAKISDYPYILEGIQSWAERMQWYRPDAIANDQNKAIELFVSGQGAMMYGGTWSVGDILAKTPEGSDFELGFFVVPIDDEGSAKLNTQVDQAFMVNPKSENAEAAVDFLEFWLTDGAATWSEATNMPLVTGATSDAMLPLVVTIAEIKASGNSVGYGDFTSPFNSEFTTAWRKGLNEFAESCVTGGDMTPEECAANIQEYFDNAIATN